MIKQFYTLLLFVISTFLTNYEVSSTVDKYQFTKNVSYPDETQDQSEI